MGEVFAEVEELRSAVGFQTVGSSQAFLRIKKHLATHSARRRITLPQALIDEAFTDEAEAIAWFQTGGMTLISGRIQGLPTMARILREGKAPPLAKVGHRRRPPAATKSTIEK